MSMAELVFKDHIFQIVIRFAENVQLLTEPSDVCSPDSDAHFRLFMAAIDGSTTQINLGSLSSEFQFIDAVGAGMGSVPACRGESKGQTGLTAAGSN
jgi:hypothetical protein